MKIFPSMKRAVAAVLAATLTGAVGYAPPVEAANWFKLRGTEPGGTAHTLQVWGFLQPTYVDDSSDTIQSFAPPGPRPLIGELPVPGTIPPARDRQESFFFRRARIGIRGTMLPINNDIDYFILTEFGQNGTTRPDHQAILLDASMTFNQLSGGKDENGLHKLGARVRVGQFLFSQTSEALSHSTPGRRVHIFMPEATFQTALTRRVNDNAPLNFVDTKVDGARDQGIEVFDFAEFGDPESPLEFTYSLGIGNGDTIGETNRDDNFRTYAWLSLAKLLDKTRGPRRHDMMVYGWYQNGDIEFNNDVNGDGVPDHRQINPINGIPTSVGGFYTSPANAGQLAADRLANRGNITNEEQTYWGVGVEYFDKPFDDMGQIRFEAEYQKVKGLVFDGTQSPAVAFNGPEFDRLGLRYNPDSESEGWYVDVGYDIHQHLGIKKRTTINIRYDEFDRNKDNPGRRVNLKTWSLTGEYFFHKKARLTATWQRRDWDANDRTLAVPRKVGNAVLGAVDNRFALQVTFIFKNVLLR